MRWCFAIALISSIGCGCRAPAPTLDPFAPYGNRVIPPPTTGSIGTPNGYYQPPPGTAPTPLPGSTSWNPLQPVPSVASPPGTPRTSSLPNAGSWESTRGPNNGFGYVSPQAPPTLAAASPFNSTAPWGASPPSTTFIPAVAASPYQAPPFAQPASYTQPTPSAQATYPPPLPVRPSWVRSTATAGSYVDPNCCIPGGDGILIPQPDPMLGTSVTGYPSGYGSVAQFTNTTTTGWRPRR